MTLSELASREIKSTSPATTILKVAEEMRLWKIGSLFIEENGRYIGIVTDSDLSRKVLTKKIPYDMPARDIMHSPILEIDIEKSMVEANHLMHLNGIRHLAISEEGRIIGLVSVRDIVQHFYSDQNSTLNKMEDIYNPLSVLTRRHIQSISGSASCREAAQKMTGSKIGSLLVSEGRQYSGIVTETDLTRKIIGFNLSASDIPVGAIMNTPIVDIDISRSVLEATEKMALQGIRHLAVREEKEIVGILSIRDLIGMISIRDLPRFSSKKD
ncbi:MAG: CBS domain-containing protein [Nitrospira sp.]|nr:CBS domain-containing protein [Candidatus Manganitrophaceae bacterium]HIL35584.1 CBS domain-containing protein [Candidatus Manganitrophaceae bacterium]